MMTPEDRSALRQLLILNEGLRLKPYSDTVGKLTIGVGRNLIDVGISEPEAYYLLDNDITEKVNGLLDLLPWAEALDAPAFRVLTDIAFNTGVDGLMHFHKMLAALHKGDRVTAAAEVIDSTIAPARAKRLAALLRS